MAFSCATDSDWESVHRKEKQNLIHSHCTQIGASPTSVSGPASEWTHITETCWTPAICHRGMTTSELKNILFVDTSDMEKRVSRLINHALGNLCFAIKLLILFGPVLGLSREL